MNESKLKESFAIMTWDGSIISKRKEAHLTLGFRTMNSWITTTSLIDFMCVRGAASKDDIH